MPRPRTRRVVLLGFLALAALASGSLADNPRTHAWVDCELYRSVVTPATFDHANGKFDELYTGGNGFRDGIGLISDAAPGDRDYNGGRWHLNLLKDTVDPDKYADACSYEDLDPADFESTDTYFECPLLPSRGQGPR